MPVAFSNLIGQSTFSRYAVAGLGVAGALFIRFLLDPFLVDNFGFITFYGGVAVAVWFGGWRPALLGALAGFLLAEYFFIPPRYQLAFAKPALFAGFIGYSLSCGLIVFLGEAMRRARERAEEQQELIATTLASIGDAVIVANANGKVASLNAEAERLTAWKSAEAAGRSLAEVFPIFNERTRQPIENPVEKVLRLGTVTGLANHTVLVARDGREIPIDDSAAPIRHDNGPILGVVLVFRDVTAQRRAEEERARLAAIVEYSGDAIFTKDLNGRINSWNKSAQRLFGYETEEILGKPVTVLFPPDRLHEEDEILARLRAGEPSERLETFRVAKDGRHIPVSLSVSPLKDRDGNVIGASKIVHDISDIVEAREELMREKELLATTLASIGDAVILTDDKGKVTFINSEAEHLTGWTSDEAKGRPLGEVFQIINENTREPSESPVDRVLRLGSVIGLANHTVLIAKDGREIPIDDSAAPIRRPGGPLFGIVLVFRDFTERRRAEEALRAKEAELETIINATPFMLTRCTRDLHYRFVSRAYAEMLGQEPGQIAGKPLVEVMGEKGLSTILPYVERVLKGERVEFETEVPFQGAGTPALRVVYTPDRDDQGQIIGWIGSIIDITDRKRAELEREQLLKSEQELRQLAEEANRLKDEFLAIMSHELRNPLNVILGYSELLVRSDSITRSPQLQRMAEAIKRNAVSQAKLIRDLLDLTRLRSGKLELNREPVSLELSINNAIDTVRDDAVAKRIEIEVNACGEVLFVEGDPVRLEQIVWNLLNNSIKFTPPGGRIEVLLAEDNGQAVLTVADTGQGIEASFLPHVFELFRQADGSTRRAHAGMGIGLAVVQQLVDLHKGSISVHSAGEGNGATFTLKFPLSVATPLAASSVPNLAATLDQISVLVVDDSEDSTQMLNELLKTTGARVVPATSGEEALRIVAEHEFDVVLSDISMPGMDGFEFLRHLRRVPGRENVPVLALTGFGRPEDIERAQQEGFYSHITKPLDLDALLRILQHIPRRTQ